MADAVECRVITRFSELEEFASEWDRLWALNSRRQIFNRFSWMRAWWRGYGSHVSLCTPVAFKDGKVVGILPLVRSQMRLRFLGEPGSDYNDVLCEDARAPEILESLFHTLCAMPRNLWRRVILTNVPEHSLLLAHIPKLPRQLRRRLVSTPGQPCPTVVLKGENREAILRAILEQREPRQHEKQLEKLGNLTFRHVEDRDEIRRHLPLFFEQHVQRWAMTADTNSRFLGAESRAFYEGLVDELDPRDELRFAVMEINGRSVAYHLGFELDGKFLHYKPTFDINLWEKSPGQVMNRRLFSYARSSAVNEFDFTIGNEGYKSRFANHVRQNFTVSLFRAGMRDFAVRKFFELRKQAGDGRHPFAVLQAIGSRLTSFSTWARNLETGRSPFAWLKAALFFIEDVFLFSRERAPASESDLAPSSRGSQLRVAAATLSDLANSSVNGEERLDRSILQAARSRFKRGDLAYLAHDGDKLVGFAWLGMRNQINPLNAASGCQISLPHPAALIYDLWLPPSLQGKANPNILRAIAREGHRKAQEVWIYCRSRDVALRSAIESVGFQSRGRIKRIRFLGLSRISIRPQSMCTALGQALTMSVSTTKPSALAIISSPRQPASNLR
jgi:CelD/BcsL family acetyltransferase involved in cellulose biosynthesis